MIIALNIDHRSGEYCSATARVGCPLQAAVRTSPLVGRRRKQRSLRACIRLRLTATLNFKAQMHLGSNTVHVSAGTLRMPPGLQEHNCSKHNGSVIVAFWNSFWTDSYELGRSSRVPNRNTIQANPSHERETGEECPSEHSKRGNEERRTSRNVETQAERARTSKKCSPLSYLHFSTWASGTGREPTLWRISHEPCTRRQYKQGQNPLVTRLVTHHRQRLFSTSAREV